MEDRRARPATTVLIPAAYADHTIRFQLAYVGLLQPHHVERAPAGVDRTAATFLLESILNTPPKHVQSSSNFKVASLAKLKGNGQMTHSNHRGSEFMYL